MAVAILSGATMIGPDSNIRHSSQVEKHQDELDLDKEALDELELSNEDAAAWTGDGEEMENETHESNLSNNSSTAQKDDHDQKQDPLADWNGPTTRSRAKAQQEAFHHLINFMEAKEEEKTKKEPACWFNVFMICN